MAVKIRRDDEVIVISGKDRGKTGKDNCLHYNHRALSIRISFFIRIGGWPPCRYPNVHFRKSLPLSKVSLSLELLAAIGKITPVFGVNGRGHADVVVAAHESVHGG